MGSWRLGLWRVLLMFPLVTVLACAQDDGRSVGANGAGTTVGVDKGAREAVTETPFVLPTLLPTQTPPAAPSAAAQSTAITPAVQGTAQGTAQATVDFDQPVVEVRYRIPALQLDRRLEGNVSGQITVVDEARGVAGIRQNQGGVLLELQEILPTLDLQPLPDGCQTCVAFSYDMPLAETQGEGWLQDPVLLASVENYTSALLGPHFPPGTVLGLRRSATAYDVAHSLALTSDGRLYRWLATAAQVTEAEEAAEAAPELEALLAEAAGAQLAEQYVVTCVSAPVETLFLEPDATPDSGGLLAEEGQAIRIMCPSFSLSRSLLPLYLRLDSLLEETLAGSGLPRPPTEVALDTILEYRRDDGARLEVALDGVTRISAEAGDVVTTTMSSSEVMTLTGSLLDSNVLQPGLEAFSIGDTANLLLVRGENGMLEAAWAANAPPGAIAPIITRLDELIDLELGDS